MIKNSILCSVMVCSFLLSGCDDSQNNKDAQNKPAVTTQKNQSNAKPALVQQNKQVPQKQKILMAENLIPLSTLDPDQDTHVFVQLSGTLVNVAKDNSWGVLEDGDVQYFAFGHAAMELFTAEGLGQPVYIRAAVEKMPVTDNLHALLTTRGLKPENVSAKLNRDYQLNTTKFNLASEVSREEFEYMDKL